VSNRRAAIAFNHLVGQLPHLVILQFHWLTQ